MVEEEILKKKESPGEYLKILMKSKGETQKSIADLLQVSQSTVSLVLKNKKSLTKEQAILVAEKLCDNNYENFYNPELAKQKTVVKTGKVLTSISVGTAKEVGEGTQEQPILVKELLASSHVTPCYSEVSMSYGATKSLGNFEFIRCDVWAKDFCEFDKKQECWDNLEKEISTRMEKVLNDVTKFIGEKAQVSVPSNDLPPLLEQTEPIQKEGEASIELKKCIHKEVFRLAKLGKLRYNNAIQKLKETKLDYNSATILLEQLTNNDISFFVGEDKNVEQQLEDNSEQIVTERIEQE